MSDPLLAALESQWGGKNIEISGDWEGEENQPLTLDHQKTTEQIRKLQIENEAALNNLIEKKMIQAILEAVGQSIQTSFVDFSRRESPVIAATLGVPHLERDLENMLSKKIQISIDSVKATCVKLIKDGMFE